MKTVKMFIVTALLINSAFSYNFSAFSLSTGENTFAVNPYMYCDTKGFIGTDLFLSYGVTDKFDLFTNIWLNNAPSGNFGWSAMLRYDLGKSNIIALRFSPTYITPQVHITKDWMKFRLQANALAQFPYANMNKPSVYAIIGPGLKLGRSLIDINCEVNPGYFIADGETINGWYRTKGFGLDIIPSIGFTIKTSMFNVAVPVYEVTRDPNVTFGMWWFYTVVSK